MPVQSRLVSSLVCGLALTLSAAAHAQESAPEMNPSTNVAREESGSGGKAADKAAYDEVPLPPSFVVEPAADGTDLHALPSCCADARSRGASVCAGCGSDLSLFDPIFTVGEPYKNIPLDFLGCNTKLSYGGELRLRTMDEDNRLRPGGPGHSTYELWRWRQWIDLNVNDFVKAHVEMIDASSFGEELPETPIDVDRWDLYGAYVDIKLAEPDEHPIYLRYGRQDLLYGSQHLVSPLDWANTRRNFEGFKLYSPGEFWDVDAFATRPVNAATANIFRPESANRADASRTFSGVYATFHGIEKQALDFYWLWLREQEERPGVADGSRHTTGIRWAGTIPVYDGCGCDPSGLWDWDAEMGYQFGHDEIDETVKAGFLSAVLGHTWTSAAWQPRLAALYYWGSGDENPTDDENNTFSVLFPLGHAYWGILDNQAGQNLQDYSLEAHIKPLSKLSLVAAMHWFDLDSNSDRLYSLAGTPVGTAGSGVEVGEELDLIGTYAFNPNWKIQLGYSWLWYGGYIENSTLRRDDASQLYFMSTYNY